MPEYRIFQSVSVELFERFQALGRTYDVMYDPPSGPNGYAHARTPLGTCKVAFALDAETSQLTLVICEKPMLLPANKVWKVLGEAIDDCRARDGTAAG